MQPNKGAEILDITQQSTCIALVFVPQRETRPGFQVDGHRAELQVFRQFRIAWSGTKQDAWRMAIVLTR